MRIIWLLVMILVSGRLCFGYIFYDDFSGDELKPHWKFQTEGPQWDYEVTDGMLKVNKIIPGGGVWLYTYLTAGDFDLRAKVGWDFAEVHSLYVFMGVLPPPPTSSSLSVMGYKKFTNDATIIATFDGGKHINEIPAPTSGFHEFRMTRFGVQRQAFFNDELILEGTGSQSTAYVLTLAFYGSDSDKMAPLYVDEISVVVSEPMTVLSTAFFTILFLSKRRK